MDQEPNIQDFIDFRTYESETPIVFGFPEQPVLYFYQSNFTHSVFVSSSGVHIYNKQLRQGRDFHLNENFEPPSSIDQDKFGKALRKCRLLFACKLQDNVELAVPLECESGVADDLGEEALACVYGEGTQLKTGPAQPRKRRRT